MGPLMSVMPPDFVRVSWLWVCAALVSLGVLSSGCGGEPPPATAGDEYVAEPFRSTVVLSAEALGALRSVEPDGRLTFAGTPTELADVAPRKVLLAGISEQTPVGFVRMVTSVETSSHGLVLQTVQVPIQLAFRKLHVRVERSIDDIGKDQPDWTPMAPQASGGVWPHKNVSFFAFNGDDDPSSPDDQVRVQGELGGGFHYVFGLDVDWGAVFEVPDAVLDCMFSLFGGSGCDVEALIPEAKVGFEVTAGATAELALDGVAFLPYSRPYTLGVVHLKPITIGPLVFDPVVEVKALIEGSASSRFSLATKGGGQVKTGVWFSNKSGADVQPPEHDFSFEALDADALLGARGRVSVGPELHLRLYGVMGPYAGLSTFAELDADRERTPCWSLRAGVESTLGFDIAVTGLPVIGSVNLANWGNNWVLVDEELASGSCPDLPEAPPPSASGGEPSAQAFVSPSFAPWSRTYGGVVARHPFGGAGAQIDWTQATPTIDGRFVLTGSSTKALTKIETDGSLVWAKRYRGPEVYGDTLTDELFPSSVANATDATMLVAAHPFTLMKVEADGNAIWARQFRVPHRETTMRITALAPTGDGGFWVGANHGDNAALHLDVDAWLMRLDASGEVQWARRWGAAGVGETLRALVPFESGVVALGSTWDDSESRWTGWAVRLAGDGALVWARRFRGTDSVSGDGRSVFLTSGLVTQSGDLVLAGSVHHAFDETLVLKLRPDGALAWSSSETPSDPTHIGPAISTIVALPTSGYLVSGTVGYSESGSYSNVTNDLFVGALDGVGRVQWMRRLGGHREEDGVPRDDDSISSVTLTRDGGALVLGYTDSLVPEGDGLWASKVPAKNGQIAFAPGGSAVTGDVTVQASDTNLGAEPWAPTLSSFVVAPEPLEVKTEAIVVPSYTQE